MRAYLLCIYCLLAVIPVAAQDSPKLIPYRDGNLWGYADTTGRIVVPVQFEKAWPFVTNLLNVSDYAYILGSGNTSNEDYYNWPKLQHPVALVVKDSLFGLLDENGDVLIPPVSKFCFRFAPLNAYSYKVCYNSSNQDQRSKRLDKIAVLAGSGKYCTPFDYGAYFIDYEEVYEQDEYAFKNSAYYSNICYPVAMQKGNDYGLVSSCTGAVLVSPMWDKILPGEMGRHVACTQDTLHHEGLVLPGYYLIDSNNHIMHKIDDHLKVEEYAGFGLFMVRNEDGYKGCINGKGEIVIPCNYRDMYKFSKQGYARTSVDHKEWYLVDTVGHILSKHKDFILSQKIPEGYFVQESDGLWYACNAYYEKYFQQGFTACPQPISVCGKKYYRATRLDSMCVWDILENKVFTLPYNRFIYPLDKVVDNFGQTFAQAGVMASLRDLPVMLDCNFKEVTPLGTQSLYYGPHWWRFRKYGKEGIYDSRNHTLLLPDIFDNIHFYPQNNYFAVQQGSYWGKLDTNGKVLLPVVFDSDFFEKTDRTLELVNSKYGWFVFDSVRTIKAFLGNIFDDSEPTFCEVQMGTDKWLTCISATVKGKPALFDLQGMNLIPPKYDSFQVANGYVLVSKQNLWGVLRFPGLEEILPIAYASVSYSEGKFVVFLPGGNLFDVYDPIHKTFNRGKKFYQSFSPFEEGLAIVQSGALFGYVDTALNEIIPPRFTDARPFSEGLAAVKTDNQCWGFINKKGKFVILAQFKEVESFKNGYAIVWGHLDENTVIDRKGRKRISLQKNEWSRIYRVADYIILQEHPDQNTIYNSALKPILNNCLCVLARPQAGIMLQYYCKDKAGLIADNGRIIHDESHIFYDSKPNGYNAVSYATLWGLKDSTGSWTIPLANQVGYLIVGSDLFYGIQKYNCSGVFHAGGKEIIPCMYGRVELRQDLWYVSCDSNYGLYDLDGSMIVPVEFKSIKPVPALGLIVVTDQQKRIGFYDFQGRKYFRN